jgi:hypothetical protein
MGAGEKKEGRVEKKGGRYQNNFLRVVKLYN